MLIFRQTGEQPIQIDMDLEQVITLGVATAVTFFFDATHRLMARYCGRFGVRVIPVRTDWTYVGGTAYAKCAERKEVA